jgi:hypothetical protein
MGRQRLFVAARAVQTQGERSLKMQLGDDWLMR